VVKGALTRRNPVELDQTELHEHSNDLFERRIGRKSLRDTRSAGVINVSPAQG